MVWVLQRWLAAGSPWSHPQDREKRPVAVAHYRRIKPDSGNQLPHCVNDTGVVAGWGGPRFLVPQYVGDDPSGCCAATVLNSHLALNLVDQKASP
jgi:hypothetical protein